MSLRDTLIGTAIGGVTTLVAGYFTLVAKEPPVIYGEITVNGPDKRQQHNTNSFCPPESQVISHLCSCTWEENAKMRYEFDYLKKDKGKFVSLAEDKMRMGVNCQCADETPDDRTLVRAVTRCQFESRSAYNRFKKSKDRGNYGFRGTATYLKSLPPEN